MDATSVIAKIIGGLFLMGCLFWFLGEDMNKATYAVLAILITISAELDLKFKRLEKSIAELKKHHGLDTASPNEGKEK